MSFMNFITGLLVCFLLSFLLGVERQFRRRFLGLRTMILVSVGAYLFVSFSFLVTGYQIDISRIAAQVVAGIGFLGAGVIIKDNKKNKITGLTTAATMWCDASIGILCAGGFIKEAIVASLVVLFANVILRYIDNLINIKVEEKNISETFLISFNVDKNDNIREYVIDYIDKVDYMEINSYEVNNNMFKLEIVVRKSDVLRLDKFIHRVVSEYNITNYKYKKVSKFKLEGSEEL